MRRGGEKVYHILRKSIAVMLVFFMMIFMSLAGSTAMADTLPDIYVSAGGADDGDGSQGNPYNTIQAGIDSVSAGGTVHVAAGTYEEHLVINKNVNLAGAGQTNTIIDGTKTGRVIAIGTTSKCTVSITGFTISNGKITSNTEWGGGIFNNFEATTTITDCTITANTTFSPQHLSAHGGGVSNYGTITITGCTVINNFTDPDDGGQGGAIYNAGPATITDCIITGNRAGSNLSLGSCNGGGIYNCYTATINGCTLTGNRAGNRSDGGGICNTKTATITDCTITGNRAGDDREPGKSSSGGDGGGIYTQGTATITNCTITGNSAGNDLIGDNSGYGHGGSIGGDGGGIYNCYDGTVEISGSIITGNYAGLGLGEINERDGYGSAVYNASGSVTANDNWWGTVYDPTSVANQIGGTVTVDSWLLEKTSAAAPAAAPVTITTDNLRGGIVGEAYSFSLQISGGNAPYTWQSSGLPASLSMDSAAGEITGTPAAKGSYAVSATVTDADGSTDSKTYTLVLDESCGDGKYLVIPVADDTNYTTGFTNDDIPMMTVNSGISGLKYFSVNICPVTGHSGDETAVFVHMRGDMQVGFSAVRADFDEMHSAQAAFNIQEGDIIKVFLFDNLNNNHDSNPVLL